jgi:hypothetical protein
VPKGGGGRRLIRQSYKLLNTAVVVYYTFHKAMSHRSDSMTTSNAMPEQNEERARIRALFESLDLQPRIAFPPPRKSIAAPTTHGVYVIRAPDGTVLHVGRTVYGENGLANRLHNHFTGKSSFVRAYLNGNTEILRSSFSFQYIEVENARERALLEHHATAWHCPAHLGLGRKGNNE